MESDDDAFRSGARGEGESRRRARRRRRRARGEEGRRRVVVGDGGRKEGRRHAAIPPIALPSSSPPSKTVPIGFRSVQCRDAALPLPCMSPCRRGGYGCDHCSPREVQLTGAIALASLLSCLSLHWLVQEALTQRQLGRVLSCNAYFLVVGDVSFLVRVG